MKSDPGKLLNQLVVAVLTVFIVVVLLLAALVLRQLWLQQRIADLSSEVQVSLDDLEEITEDIQRELAESRVAGDELQSMDDLQEVTEALTDVDEQLGSLGEDLNGVVLASEPAADAISPLTAYDEQADATRDQVDQVFTVFAVIVGIASIAIAVLLGVAVRAHQSTL